MSHLGNRRGCCAAQVARLAAAIRIGRRSKHRPRRRGSDRARGFPCRGCRARRGLRVVRLSSEFGDEALDVPGRRCCALLFGRRDSRDVNRTPRFRYVSARSVKLRHRATETPSTACRASSSRSGRLSSASLDDFDAVLAVIDRRRRVPRAHCAWGGLFADAVRDVDQRVGLPDDAAHWMAVLAMDESGRSDCVASEARRARA